MTFHPIFQQQKKKYSGMRSSHKAWGNTEHIAVPRNSATLSYTLILEVKRQTDFFFLFPYKLSLEKNFPLLHAFLNGNWDEMRLKDLM